MMEAERETPMILLSIRRCIPEDFKLLQIQLITTPHIYTFPTLLLPIRRLCYLFSKDVQGIDRGLF
jgi:hypothetical protein